MGPKLRFLGICILITGVFFGLDRIFYGKLIFAPDFRGSWDQHRWYAFEYNFRRIQQEKSKKDLVLVVGSSIAKYSVQEDLIEKVLSRKYGLDVRVRTVVHASMLPNDLYFYMPRIQSLGPRAILYVTNPADLDLERYSAPWEAAPVYSDFAAFNYMKTRRPMLSYYPGAFAREYHRTLGVQESLRLQLRNSLYVLRFKDEWIDPLLFYRRAGDKHLRSYLNYQGIPLREGLWREGLSGACFSIDRTDPVDSKRIMLQFMKELHRKTAFTTQLYSYREALREKKQPRTLRSDDFDNIRDCRPPKGAVLVKNLRPRRPGWQPVKLAELEIHKDHNRLFFRLSHVVDPAAPIAKSILKVKIDSPPVYGKGLRIAGNFGLNRPRGNDYMVRRRSLEDLRYLKLSPGEYRRDFEKRLQPDDWRHPKNGALHQFNSLRLAKYYVHWYDFSSTYQVRRLKQIFKILGHQTPLTLVNNPENPVAREEYDESNWYRGYLDFMVKSAAKYPGLSFADYHRKLPEKYFSDAHHLTFYGMEQMVPEYAALIARMLGKK